jgi:hypothetical protein
MNSELRRGVFVDLTRIRQMTAFRPSSEEATNSVWYQPAGMIKMAGTESRPRC